MKGDVYILRETRSLEFKEQVNNKFLKTVSAFANYENVEIYFGVSDDGMIIGIDDFNEEALKIENKINTTIFPRPSFSI